MFIVINIDDDNMTEGETQHFLRELRGFIHSGTPFGEYWKNGHRTITANVVQSLDRSVVFKVGE